MKRRLSLKFLEVYLLFVALAFLVIALYGETLFKNYAQRLAITQMTQQVISVANDQIEHIRESGAINVTELNHLSDITNLRIFILNKENRVVYDSRTRLLGRTIPDFNSLDSPNSILIGNFYNTFDRDMICAYSYISFGPGHPACLVLAQDLQMARDEAQHYLPAAYLVYLFVILMSFFPLVMIYRWVLKPIGKISEGAQEYAEGNLSHRIRFYSDDELGYLSASLNDMAAQIQSTDETQRNFIANVAHDFRSPLTSIKGYLEAMVDGVIPPENQDKYMNIIIGETERLANLTQSMLSLNSLDDARLGLELSSFDIVAQIRSVCDTFEVICQRRGLHFDLIFSSPVIMVRADFGRINQVLHNLIDNAIKFSHEQSLIRIRVREVRDKASISVKDFGQGIPKEDIGKIWTRFYKGDRSRGKDKRGTGLGLSIIREIMRAHGESIDVTSTPGSGTEFVFRLPLAKKGE